MRIKYDYQIFTAQKYGGISKYFYYLAMELNKLEVKADIISLLYINELIRTKDYVLGFKINTKSRIIIRLLKYINMIIDHLFIKSSHYDILHKTYYSVISGSSSTKSSKNVITVYDMTHEIYPNFFKDSKHVSSKKLKACTIADKIICISHSTKKDLINQFNIHENKISVIHLGVDSNIFKKIDNQTEYENNYGNYILYVGQRYGYKNFSYLFDTYMNSEIINNNYNLVLFGGEKLSKYENELIKRKNLKKKIFFISGSDQLLSYLYNHAHVLVYTSLYEGFGLPVLEAMSSGCPVIAFNGSSIPEVAGDACILMNNMNSKSELSSNIVKLGSDKNFRKTLVDKGIIQAKKFTWENCAKKTLDVYMNAIEKL